ncbi:unnamed protein product [Litomosoides sigmodontis]|uniref:Uncharacterized protein n=1 Tax=Litomosoides sigmodontis TaxID=42156 RepID=A0A3P6TE81_LITSI|nr:unnamed protein product [Litomosoides sigmodontis]
MLGILLLSKLALEAEKGSALLHVFPLQMSNSTAAKPTSGGSGIRSFFSKLRKPSDLQISPAQVSTVFWCQAFSVTACP